MTAIEFLRWVVDKYVAHDCHNDPECREFLAAEENRKSAHEALDTLEKKNKIA